MRRHELAFLDIHDPAGPPGRDQQIRLPAKKRGNLQDVGHFGRAVRPARAREYRSGREASRLHAAENAQALLKSGSAIPVERWCGWPYRMMPLKTKGPAIALRDRLRHPVNVLFALDDARTGDQDQRAASRESESSRRPQSPAEITGRFRQQRRRCHGAIRCRGIS